jgi:AAA+ ATPase superfamily predicted ATPase
LGTQWIPLLVDSQSLASSSTLSGFATGIAEQISRAAVGLPYASLTLPTPAPGEIARDPFPALEKWMSRVESRINNNRFILCLDEFERLDEVIEQTGSRAPLNFIRSVIQHRDRWVLLFSGSHSLDDLPDYWSDYLINTISLRVGYLQEDETRELITKPIPDFPDVYEPEAVERIIHLTRCHPYLVQLICYALVEYLNIAKRKRAAPEDVDAIIPKVFEMGTGYFNEFWRLTLNETEREVLSCMVLGEKLPDVKPGVFKKLVQKEVLEKADGSWRFQVPLIEMYVRERVTDVF